jgi:hypothetical protein
MKIWTKAKPFFQVYWHRMKTYTCVNAKPKEKGKVKGSGRGRTALYVQMLRVYGMCCIEQ